MTTDGLGAISWRLGGLAVAALLLLCAGIAPGHAHHVMDYAAPATALDGFLSGLGHPVIGLDHLLFVIGAGVLAARVARGFFLPFVFAIASILAVCVRFARPEAALSELWVAGSLLALALVMLAWSAPRGAAVAALFLLAGAIHGYALAEGVIGAERTPLYAYLAGLALVLMAIASCAWAVARAAFRSRPALPLHRLTGAAIGIAGVFFAASAVLA